jgi:hypothetical protein
MRRTCGARCRHRLVWVKLPSGKTTQARECQDPRYLKACAELACALAKPVDAELVALVTKAVSS